MNLRTILLTTLIFLISFGCSPNSQKAPITQDAFDFEIDPNTMTLVTYKLVGETLPGKPKVVPANDSATALFERFGISFDIKQIDDNTWKGPLVLGDSYVIGWIVEDKKLFGYCSEPFTATKNLEVTFSPGMPSTLEYDMTEPPDNIHIFPAEFLVRIETISKGKQTYLSWGINPTIEEPKIVTVEGLAAGTYKLTATVSNNEQYAKEREPFLYDERDIKIKKNTYNRLDAIYPEIDTMVEENDVTIRGTLYDKDKEPLPDTMVQIIPYIHNTNKQMLDLYYPKLTTDSEGKFEFVGVRPNITATVNIDYTSIFLTKELLKENACISLDILMGTVTFPTEIGAPVKDLIIDSRDGDSSKLSDFIGKTVVLDFWATWCRSCKETIPELNSLAAKFSERSDVTFIELSIDFDRADWEQALDKSDWNQLRHGWLDLKKNYYVLNRDIPYSVIIDKNGIIRASGDDLDIELELEKILGNSN